MSGKWLHGLVVEGGDVIVEDNIFSHSELREKYTGREAPHPMIREWSWDYVEREFQSTPEELRSLCQGWLDTNLATYAQLRAWLARNWKGLVEDEKERELYVWELLTTEATSTDPLVEAFIRADQDWRKAYQDLRKAEWVREQAEQDWRKADQDWRKAYQDLRKADQDWRKADQDWRKAEWVREQADQDLEQADQTWKMQVMKPIFFDLLDQFVVPQWRGGRRIIMETPKKEQLLEEDGLKVVSRISDPSWRHGTYETKVFCRGEDNTFWEVKFQLSTDGETNGLREGEYLIRQVTPQEKTIIIYV